MRTLERWSPHALLVGLLLSPTTALGEPSSSPRRGLDYRALFGAPDGVLSAGYPDRHATSTARPLSFVTPRAGPTVSVLFNPALAPLGKWSGRLELAPVRALSLFAEASFVRGLKVPRVASQLSRYVDGEMLDVGLHLFPAGKGLRGFYIGPRLSLGAGDTQDGLARGTLRGWGFDLGVQWNISALAFNLGAGLAHNDITLKRGDDAERLAAERGVQIPEELGQGASRAQLLPLITAGVGFAF